MSPSTVVFYISGHGFGHATRDFEVIRHIRAQRPDARIVIRSAVARWFVEQSASGPVELEPAEIDTGIVQIDSLRLDEDETARRAAAFYATFDARADAEARVLQTLGASVVVGDIPPLAFAAAARARVPSIALGNFTWDWIYAAYPSFASHAPGVVDITSRAYGRATLALRLPFHGGFESMRAVTRDVPLVGRRSAIGRDRTRALLQFGHDRLVVLASFGGHGADLPFARAARESGITLVVTNHEMPSAANDPHVRHLTRELLEQAGLRYEDLVAAADIVVSKPGYGIVSECIANGTALLYTSRGHFAENEVLVDGMTRVLRTTFVSQDDLRAGRWRDAIERLQRQPAPPERMEANGGPIAAAAILELAGFAETSRAIVFVAVDKQR